MGTNNDPQGSQATAVGVVVVTAAAITLRNHICGVI
jgi:hypothetical protein